MNNPYENLDHDFLVKLKKFEKELANLNINADPVCGYRSLKQQAILYGQGRTGVPYARPDKTRVTNAKPGDSPHNFGLAMDYIPFVGHRTYNVKATWWLKFGLAAKRAGLVWGGSFRKFIDRPHVEYPNWRKKVQK